MEIASWFVNNCARILEFVDLDGDNILHFVVGMFKNSVNAAPALARMTIDDIISEKGAIFAMISVAFAIAIKNLPGDYIILFLFSFGSLEIIDKFAQINI